MYEQMMNIVKERGGRKERGFIVLLQGEHTYPVRLESRERGGRRWEVGEKVG